MVPFSTSDSAHLEESYRRDPSSRVALGGGRFVVHLDRMVSVTRGQDGERAVRRSEPYARLVELLEDYRVGVTSLCYHRLNDRVCVTTGHLSARCHDSYMRSTARCLRSMRGALRSSLRLS